MNFIEKELFLLVTAISSSPRNMFSFHCSLFKLMPIFNLLPKGDEEVVSRVFISTAWWWGLGRWVHRDTDAIPGLSGEKGFIDSWCSATYLSSLTSQDVLWVVGICRKAGGKKLHSPVWLTYWSISDSGILQIISLEKLQILPCAGPV